MSRDSPWHVAGRGEVSRDALVRTGMDVLLERGWTGLTARAVAARAGVAPGLVGYHYGGMAAFRRVVLAEVLLDMLTPAVEVMTSRASWQEGLAAVLQELADEAAAARERRADDGWADEAPTDGYEELIGGTDPGPGQRHVLADAVVASMQDVAAAALVTDSLRRAREGLLEWLGRLGVPEQHRDGAAVLLLAAVDGLLLHLTVDPDLLVTAAAALLHEQARLVQRAPSGRSMLTDEPSPLPQPAATPQPSSRAGTTSCSKSSMPLVS